MTTPIVRENQGSLITRTYANSVPNNSYNNVADILTINNSGGALMVDFALTSVVFATAPIAGNIQLCVVDRDLLNNQGPSPSTNLQPFIVGIFNPIPLSSNTLTGWIMTLELQQARQYSDYWIFPLQEVQ